MMKKLMASATLLRDDPQSQSEPAHHGPQSQSELAAGLQSQSESEAADGLQSQSVSECAMELPPDDEGDATVPDSSL